MEIIVQNLKKKYQNKWLFKNFSYKFTSNKSYGIIGKNGSGKSTLMKIILGYTKPDFGNVEYWNKKKKIKNKLFFQHNAFCAPYINLIEELKLKEFLKFHFSFKKKKNISINEISRFVSLENNLENCIKNFSSGMKQKIKLGITFLSDAPIILLDEPTSNLDNENIDWYLYNIKKIINKKIIIIFSNNYNEYKFCKNIINIDNFK